jgi:hypothetical protein
MKRRYKDKEKCTTKQCKNAQNFKKKSVKIKSKNRAKSKIYKRTFPNKIVMIT